MLQVKVVSANHFFIMYLKIFLGHHIHYLKLFILQTKRSSTCTWWKQAPGNCMVNKTQNIELSIFIFSPSKCCNSCNNIFDRWQRFYCGALFYCVKSMTFGRFPSIPWFFDFSSVFGIFFLLVFLSISTWFPDLLLSQAHELTFHNQLWWVTWMW